MEKHCRPDYKPWEQRATCCSCGHPLADNQLVKDALIANNTASWAKTQLQILAEKAAHYDMPPWYVSRAMEIVNGIQLWSI